MDEMKYKILIDNKIVAERMNIEIALTLVKALFEKYYNDHSHELDDIVAFVRNHEWNDIPESIKDHLERWEDFLAENL